MLDSLEHLLPAAALAADLIAACPGVQILATSRASLRVRAEQQFRVPPLAVPPARSQLAGIGSYPAVQLFISRAAALRGNPPADDADAETSAAIADICRRLAGCGSRRPCGGTGSITAGSGRARRTLDALLTADARRTPEPVRARAVTAAGWLCVHQGDTVQARKRFHDALALARACEDRWCTAWAITGLGTAGVWEGTPDHDRLREQLEGVMRSMAGTGR